MYFAKETTGTFTRCFFGTCRPFSLVFYNNARRIVMYMKRFGGCLSDVSDNKYILKSKILADVKNDVFIIFFLGDCGYNRYWRTDWESRSKQFVY